jgi:outer membrane murein-binding lipoprotein Lpp
MTPPVKHILALLGAPLLTASLVGCASKVSTSSFKGEEREVAQTISNLQSDVTAGDEQKICAKDLASAVVTRLDAAPGGCKQAVKRQVAEIDSLNVTVQSVQVSAAGAQPRASARVKSVYEGKTRLATVSLVKEGGKWKISGLG